MRELFNDSRAAKIGVDTTENERAVSCSSIKEDSSIKDDSSIEEEGAFQSLASPPAPQPLTRSNE